MTRRPESPDLASVSFARDEHARRHALCVAHLPCFLCSRGRLCGEGRDLQDDADDAGKRWAWAERRRELAGRAR